MNPLSQGGIFHSLQSLLSIYMLTDRSFILNNELCVSECVF